MYGVAAEPLSVWKPYDLAQVCSRFQAQPVEQPSAKVAFL